jgi:hypothetical protein
MFEPFLFQHYFGNCDINKRRFFNDLYGSRPSKGRLPCSIDESKSFKTKASGTTKTNHRHHIRRL